MCRKLLVSASCVLILGLATTVAHADIADGLVAYWPLDEGAGATTADRSGNGNDGIFVDAPAWVPGKLGSALDFDGSNDAVNCGNSPVLDFGTGDFTISCWINVETRTGDQAIFGKGDRGGTCYFLKIRDDGNGDIKLRLDDGSTQLDPDTDDHPGLYAAPGWHHLVAMRRTLDNKIHVYVDGVDDQGVLGHGESNIPAGYDLSATSLHNAYIGAIENTPLGRFFDGSIDDVAVWNRALTVEEINYLWNDGTGNPVDVTPPGQASDPTPANEAEDVPREVVLSWTPGDSGRKHDVYLGTTFVDVNEATIGSDLLIDESQEPNTLAVGRRLDFGQTYYWRVDEVNAVADSTVLKGSVWRFAVEPVAYPLAGEFITATASSMDSSDADPSNTIDGSGLGDDDRHSTDTATMWLSSPSEPNQAWIEYAFDKPYKLYQMLVWNYNGESILGWNGLKEVAVEYLGDGEVWTPLDDAAEFAQAPGTNDYAPDIVIAFEGLVAKRVRITAHSNWSPGGVLDQYGLSEVRFLYVPVWARELSPADGSANVDPTVELRWRAGREASVHDVYLGSNPDNLPLADVVTGSPYAAYDTSALDLQLGGQTYYWQVNEVNELEVPGTWAGEILEFSTREFLVVDDFESYTNDADTYSRVFQTWIDGAGYTVSVEVAGNGTGSYIGHDPALGDIMEKETVHGGTQSAPIYYGNGGQRISEVDRTFDEPQDWTRAGTKSLSLWFYGLASNTGQLYVKINGRKVPYPGDAGDIARAAWLPFNIDLSEIEGAQSVTSLTIGVETTGANEGVVYVDDIRLYPLTPDLIVPAEPDAAGLLTHLRFDEGAGTIAADASGNGRDGTLVRDPQWVAGKVDGALQFRQGSHVLDDDAEDYLNGLEALTVCMWIKSNVVDTDQGVLICHDPSGVDETITVRYDSSGSSSNGTNLLKVAVTSTGDVQQLESSSNVQTTEWQHICMTWQSGALLRLYVNGIEDTPTGRNNPNNTGSVSTCEKLIIGKGGKDEIASVGWDGLIDDVRIYDRALTDGEILWLSGETEPRPKPF